MRRRLCIMIVVMAGALHAQTILRWIVDPARPAPADWPVFQGETVWMEPSFVSYGSPLSLTGATAVLYWQTNGMGNAWWSAPGLIIMGAPDRVRAVWGPQNDAGASRYNYFIAATTSSGTMYRAYGTIMMRASPGATPSILAAPTTLTDAMQAWADRRYVGVDVLQDVSNAMASAHAAIHADIAAIPLPPTNVVAGWLVWDAGSNCYWRVVATNLRFYVYE